VGATDEKGVLADFSSRGVFGDPLFKPSLVAPGVNVVSLRSLGTQTGTLGLLGADYQRLSLGEIPFYTTASGTSFTAPQVSGAIALMLEANPNLSPKDIKGILQRSATPMPNYFAHEVGAGMLNTYAAVLEAAFPQRATGIFRAELERDSVKFSTSTMQITSDTPVPANSMTSAVNIFPGDLVQSSFYIAWPAGSQNDLNLSIFDVNGSLSGKSARSNPSGFFGRNEKVTISLPASDILTTQIISSSSSLSTQSFLRASDYTQVDLLPLSDISDLSPQDQAFVREAMRKYLVMPAGTKFSPLFSVSRVDLAAALVRTGKVPQFVASAPAYSDVLNLTYRNPVESVQFNPTGKLFYDVSTGGQFSPNQPASRLVAAVALVKAAQLDSLAASSALPPSVADANSIPVNLRGYAAVALQKGWLTLSNNNFDPNGVLTRLDLARATVGLCKF
jgi:serine protease AprX